MNTAAMRNWAKITFVLLCGYALFGKTFAYLGVPPLKLFVGDIFLAFSLVFFTGPVLRPLLEGLTRPTEFSAMFWWMTAGLFYGLIEVARGLNMGYPPLAAFEELVVHVYPLYFFVGLWAALMFPDLVRKYIWYVSWGAMFYAIAYFLVLRKITMAIPGAPDVPLFPSPPSGLALLGMTYFEGEIRRLWLPLSANVFVVLAGQIRSEWLALTLCMVVQSALIGKMRRLAITFGAITLVLVIGMITNVSIPSPAGRGVKMVSATEIVGRAVAAVDRDAAYEYSRNASFYAGTVTWRQNWWNAIWRSSNEDMEISLLGHGYGFRLSGLVDYLRGIDLRTPHNIFFYTLGYTGWLGVVLFFSLQLSIGLTLYRGWRLTGQPFGVVFWVAAVISCWFGDFFEAPQAAIPYYLVTGMLCADVVRYRLTVTAGTPRPAAAPMILRAPRLWIPC
jgi:hypothetical protein